MKRIEFSTNEIVIMSAMITSFLQQKTLNHEESQFLIGIQKKLVA